MNDTYNSYLLSEAWNDKRSMRMKLSGWKCEACGSKQLLQVHHLTYDRIFQEPMEDLMVLCRIHHEAAEEMKRKGAIPKTGDVHRIRLDTLRLIAPMERYSHIPQKASNQAKRPKSKKHKPTKAERRVLSRLGLEATRIWTDESLKRVPVAYHHLTWTSSKEEVLGVLLADEAFMSTLTLPQKNFRIKYRKRFKGCPPYARIASVAGTLWVERSKYRS